ncbi:uncharacterized protein LOC143907214 isoform X2 [Temnothorax americanus]|uniref:uncharacterized protein LOC143907214 isoform X2 n=1 Tax=Temnothorax americanus TaxID=1964332 RepID=UPI004067BDA2
MEAKRATTNMRIRACLVTVIVILFIFNTDGRRTSTGTSRRSGGGSSSTSGRSNGQSGYPSGNPPPYSPSGGYPRQTANNPYGGYNQPNQGYPSYNNPSPRYGGYSPYGQAYNPSYDGHSPGGYGGQQPSYVQPAIQQAPALTVLQPSRPGIGQLAKEALVYSSVSAGVSAAVNRLLPGGIYGHSPGYGNGGDAGTEITYNNYYNDGWSPANGEAPAAPATRTIKDIMRDICVTAGFPIPPDIQTILGCPDEGSNEEVKKLSERLFDADKNNAYKYVTMNLQGQTKEDGTGDDASLPLLDVKPEAYEIPTIKSLLALHDNYEMDVKTKETVTPDERKEEAELLDRFLETDVFKATMKYLADEAFIPNDEYEFKDTLKRIWFSQFQRVEGEPSSSGFEAVFVAEKLDSYMIGPQNWIYFAKQEAQKNLDYRGYINDVKLADKGEAIKVRTAFNVPDTKHSVTTLLVGLSPELEMALYTVCFYLRPNDVCPISLGGKDVNLVSTRFNYFGKDILIAGFIAG